MLGSGRVQRAQSANVGGTGAGGGGGAGGERRPPAQRPGSAPRQGSAAASGQGRPRASLLLGPFGRASTRRSWQRKASAVEWA